MPESDVVKATQIPQTVASLTADLRPLGLAGGQTVLVHSSLSRIGWVSGNAQAVVMALRAALGDRGTLVVPTHTNNNTEPSHWQNPPVPAAWWPVIRQNRPAYDPALTPTRQMGTIADTVRIAPGAIRSNHPIYSHTAWGPNAQVISGEPVPMTTELGEESEIGRLYRMDAQILLLGVGYGNCTALHLAEHRATYPKTTYTQGCAVLVDGERQWVTFETIEMDADDFAPLGAAYERTHPNAVTVGKVGNAEARFMRLRPLVDFGVPWLTEHRSPPKT